MDLATIIGIAAGAMVVGIAIILGGGFAAHPYEETRAAIAALAPVLARLPNQIRIAGHTAADGAYPNPRCGKWALSADRANVARSILTEFGVPDARFSRWSGAAIPIPVSPTTPTWPSTSASRSFWWSKAAGTARADTAGSLCRHTADP